MLCPGKLNRHTWPLLPNSDVECIEKGCTHALPQRSALLVFNIRYRNRDSFVNVHNVRLTHHPRFWPKK